MGPTGSVLSVKDVPASPLSPVSADFSQDEAEKTVDTARVEELYERCKDLAKEAEKERQRTEGLIERSGGLPLEPSRCHLMFRDHPDKTSEITALMQELVAD